MYTLTLPVYSIILRLNIRITLNVLLFINRVIQYINSGYTFTDIVNLCIVYKLAVSSCTKTLIIVDFCIEQIHRTNTTTPTTTTTTTTSTTSTATKEDKSDTVWRSSKQRAPPFSVLANKFNAIDLKLGHGSEVWSSLHF